MKKYTRKDTAPRGSLPPQLFKYIDVSHISDATAHFVGYITDIAKQFHSQLNLWGAYEDIAAIELTTPDIFGQNVKIEYIDSGTTGSVYKITIGSYVFALKINRGTRMSTDELENMHMYKRARNLVNKTYIASPFKYEGEEFTWLLSDYVGTDYKNSFRVACEKLYYAYVTKGIAFSDSHRHNFKNGKIIDADSFRFRKSNYDNYSELSRTEKDVLKKLMHYIKTNEVSEFEDLISKSKIGLVDYLWASMVYARNHFLSSRDSDDDFIKKIKTFEAIVMKYQTMLKEKTKGVSNLCRLSKTQRT